MTINKYCWCCCPGLCEGRIENMRYWWVHNSLHWFKNLMTRSWWQPALVRDCNSVIAALRPSHKMPAQLQIIQQEQSSIPNTQDRTCILHVHVQDVSNLWSHYDTSFIIVILPTKTKAKNNRDVNNNIFFPLSIQRLRLHWRNVVQDHFSAAAAYWCAWAGGSSWVELQDKLSVLAVIIMGFTSFKQSF